MKQVNDLGLELYVATEKYPDKQQYLDSQHILRWVKERGIGGAMDIIYLDTLDRQADVLGLFKRPKEELKLPYLLCGHGCEEYAFLGYSGLEEAEQTLHSLFKAQSIQNQQY